LIAGITFFLIALSLLPNFLALSMSFNSLEIIGRL
jgi:hypothetical protein